MWWLLPFLDPHPTFFEGYTIDYSEPDGTCDKCGSVVYQTKESSDVLFCPNCRRLFRRPVYQYMYKYL